MDKKVLKLTNAELKYNPKKIEKVIELLGLRNTVSTLSQNIGFVVTIFRRAGG